MSGAENVLHERVSAFLAGSTTAADLRTALSGCPARDTRFWLAVAHLEAAEDTLAAAALRGWLHDEATAGSPLRPTATALLAVAESGLVEAVRWALDTAGPRWRRACPVALDRVVAELAGTEPALLVRVLAVLPESELPAGPARWCAARAVLGQALDAEHVGLAHARLTVAERLLDGV